MNVIQFVRSKIHNVGHRIREKLMGLDIIQWESAEALGLDPMRSVDYSPSGNRDLERVLQSLQIQATDAIVDLGCGKGGALVTMAAYPFGKLGGVEISPKLYVLAQNNLAKLSIPKVVLFCGDAADFTDMSDYNYLYFYNPFLCSVMEDVLNNVRENLRTAPRNVTIIYKNPVCHQLIIGDGTFTKVAEFGADDGQPFFLYRNSS